MEASDWIAIAAVLVAIVLPLTLRFYDQRNAQQIRRNDQEHARRTNMVRALQGEKESVGYEAYRIATEGWPSSASERAEIRDALCLAAIFEGSGRTQAMVYRALKRHPLRNARG